MWMIQNTHQPSLFWSEAGWWVMQALADTFRSDEINSTPLPVSGNWVFKGEVNHG